jgi:hypothetical protein
MAPRPPRIEERLIEDILAWVIAEMWVSRSRLWRVLAVILFIAIVVLLIYLTFG